MPMHTARCADRPMSDAEWRLRVDLAAAYRLMALYGMDDGIFTHISARVPGSDEAFLLNPYGWMFDEITASSLVKVDVHGHLLEPGAQPVNPAGFTIHSAVHRGRPDARCVLHAHTLAGVAVASTADGLRPANQWSLQFHQRVAYHDFEGIALDAGERERLVADLGPRHKALILRNHGLLTLGTSVAEAFILMYRLERACRVQLAIQSSGQPIAEVAPDVAEHTARQYETNDGNGNRAGDGHDDPYAREWRALLRKLSPPPRLAYDA